MKRKKTLKYKSHISEDIKDIFKYIKNILLPKWQHIPIKKEFYEYNKRKKNSSNKSFKEFFGPFLK